MSAFDISPGPNKDISVLSIDGSPVGAFVSSMFEPSAELVQQVQERAQQEANERGIPIDQICIMATPWGHMEVKVLGDYDSDMDGNDDDYMDLD